MSVNMTAYLHGYRVNRAECLCPHCAERMKREYDDALRRQISRCINPACPWLPGNETNLINKLKQEKAGNKQMPTLTATKSEYTPLPTGEYLAQITDIEDETGNYGPQFKFTFELVQPKAYEGRTKFGWCSQKISMGSKPSKLAGWASAIFNRPIEVGEVIDTDDLVGRRCVLVIVSATNAQGDEQDNITALKAYKKQEPFPVTAAAKADARDSFEVGEPDDDDPFENE